MPAMAGCAPFSSKTLAWTAAPMPEGRMNTTIALPDCGTGSALPAGNSCMFLTVPAQPAASRTAARPSIVRTPRMRCCIVFSRVLGDSLVEKRVRLLEHGLAALHHSAPEQLPCGIGERLGAERFLDAQSLVPLRHALGAREAADLELRHAPAHGQVHDGNILGLAGARRDDGAHAFVLCGAPAGERLAH